MYYGIATRHLTTIFRGQFLSTNTKNTNQLTYKTMELKQSRYAP